MASYYFAKGLVRYKKDKWVVIEAPSSVVNYYKWWIEKFIGKKISTSYHGSHITVVAGKHEKPQSKYWGKYDGYEVEFRYSSKIYTDDKKEYFWLLVDCPRISDIRRSLGLKAERYMPTHLTIGFRSY